MNAPQGRIRCDDQVSTWFCKAWLTTTLANGLKFFLEEHSDLTRYLWKFHETIVWKLKNNVFVKKYKFVDCSAICYCCSNLWYLNKYVRSNVFQTSTNCAREFETCRFVGDYAKFVRLKVKFLEDMQWFWNSVFRD